MTDLNKIATTIENLLLEESSQPIKSRSDIGATQLRRKELRDFLAQIDSERARLSTQIYNLPELPEAKYMDWAEALLAMPNLAILVLDTTGLDDNADIIGIHAIDAQGVALIDITIAPQRQRTANTPYTGIDFDELALSPFIEQAWPQVLHALRGRFVVAFTLEFVEERLRENIEHYGLDRLPLRGDCLMKQSMRYFNIQRYGWKLAEACRRIGHTLPTPALAADRASAQLALLKAMAQGITSVPSITTDTPLDELDDHAF